jgi:hypothetical protein
MWNIDLIQIQQYYEKQVTLREVTIEKGRWKKEVKKCSNFIGRRSHTKGRTHKGETERKVNLKLECGWCAPCWGANKVI